MIRDKKLFYFILLAAIFLILLGVHHDMRTCWGSNDFDTYYFAGKLVRSGENLYTHEVFRTTMSPYLYLPFFASLIAPLTFLHIRIASAVWYVFNILAFAGSIYLSVEIAAGKGKFRQIFTTRPYLLRIVSLIFPLMVWLDNVFLAQADVMVFFLLLLSLFSYEKKRPFLSGVVLAMAGVIKVYPFYFLLYFLAKRRFKAVIGFFAGILLFIFIVPWVVLGQDNFRNSMKSWVTIRVMPYMKMGGQTVRDNFAHYESQLKPKNQALSAVVTRYSLRDDEDVSRMKKEDFEYQIYWPHPLTPVQVEIVVKALLLIIFAVTFLNLEYGLRYRDRFYLSLEYSVVFLSMLLLFPMVKSHTFAAVIFPVIVFNCAQDERGIIGRPLRIIFLSAIVLYVLQVIEYMNVLGTGCFAVLILWLLFLRIIRKERRDPCQSATIYTTWESEKSQEKESDMAEGDLLKNMTGEQLGAIRKSAEEFTGHKIYDQKIEKIGLYTRCHSYKWVTIEIGRYLDKQITGPSDEEVAAIFKTEGGYYVVCTPNHGVSQGEPFIFREQEIYKIVEEV